ncbi:MAG TPA: hypothetical protein PKK59_05765 [Anaerolineaceae bacterium]|nr:hypothetical protein [Anaerolineaceae bacterium]
MEKTNLIGAVTALAFFVSAILVFVSRLAGRPRFEFWLGIFELLLAIPLLYLLIKAPSQGRPVLYYIQLGAILLWLLVELLLDFIFKIDFRQVRWMVITYVVLFFAGAGGLLGIATNTGRPWSLIAIALFLIMAVLTFVQRAVTGM